MRDVSEGTMSPLAQLILLAGSNHQMRRERRIGRKAGLNKVFMGAHPQPHGPFYVPSTAEELYLSRPQRTILMRIGMDGNRAKLRTVIPGNVIEFLCETMDDSSGIKFLLPMGYYKVASIHYMRDTRGHVGNMAEIKLIWIPRRADDFSAYGIEVIIDDDVDGNPVYLFVKGDVDSDDAEAMFNGEIYRVRDNVFYPIPSDDPYFSTVTPDMADVA